MSSTAATPSPWRTLLRFLIFFSIFLLALIVLWTLWHFYAAHQLNLRLAAYRAAGEPASPMDLAPKLQPADNAYNHFVAAYDTLKLTADEDDMVNGTRRTDHLALPLSNADMATARTMLGHIGPSLDEMKSARQADGIAWPIDYAHYATSYYTGLSKFRTLANLHAALAMFEHQAQRDDLSLEALRNIQSISQGVEKSQSLISHLVAIACDALATRTLFDMAVDLQLQSAANPHGLTRPQIKALIAELLDPRAIQADFQSNLRGERMYPVAYDESWGMREAILIPMLRLDACESLDYWDTMIQASTPDPLPFPEFKTRLPPERAMDTNIQRAIGLLYDWSDYTIALLHYRTMVQRQAVALRLAIRLYELDHAGALPPDLHALVPDDIAALPPDLFRADGATFTYAPARRLFYSFGENGVDDGGIIKASSPPSMIYLRESDAIFELDRPSASATRR